MNNKLKVRELSDIAPIKKDSPDDLFTACGSFEERFLGSIKKINTKIFKNFILFKFTEPNERREELIKEMEKILGLNANERYFKIMCKHGNSIDAILEFHKILENLNIKSEKIKITIDISTFTKDLLAHLLLYLVEYKQINRIRCLYTSPERYASPEEGWLSFGIKSIHFPPMGWRSWSPRKDNLLLLILGFEELRAWTLIDRFPAEKRLLFITKPGTIPEWNDFCEKYNKKLLEKYPAQGCLPAIDPFTTFKMIEKEIKNLLPKYNIFVSPLGTKPQLLGIINLIVRKTPVNLVTTTVIQHNVPYYSGGIGKTFEFYFPIGGDRNEYG